MYSSERRELGCKRRGCSGRVQIASVAECQSRLRRDLWAPSLNSCIPFFMGRSRRRADGRRLQSWIVVWGNDWGALLRAPGVGCGEGWGWVAVSVLVGADAAPLAGGEWSAGAG